MDKTTATIKDLKPNGFVLIEGEPCRVERVQISSSGKHGASKARVDALGILDNRRRSIVKPASDSIDVPIILKKTAQVLSISGNKAQVMDMEDYSVFELEIPEERKSHIKQGAETTYFEVVGIRTLKELK